MYLIATLATAMASILATEEENANLVLRMFEEISEKRSVAEIDTFFSKDLILISNGFEMDYAAFREHLIEAFQSSSEISFRKPFDDLIAKGDKVTARFTIIVTGDDGIPKETQAIAIYQITDGKISRWWELTYPDWQNITAPVN